MHLLGSGSSRSPTCRRRFDIGLREESRRWKRKINKTKPYIHSLDNSTVFVICFSLLKTYSLYVRPWSGPIPPWPTPASAPIAPFSTLLDDTSAPSTPERLILRLVQSPKSQRDSEDRRSQRNDTSAPSTPERLILRLVPSPKPQHDSEDRRSPRTPKTNSLFMWFGFIKFVNK